MPRLQDLGLKPELMAGNLVGAIGQRLVRKLCPHCCEPYELDAELAIALGLSEEGPVSLKRPVGCRRCDHQGFTGRIALMEVLRLDQEMEDLLASRASIQELRKAAKANGFRDLRDDAMRRVAEGITSLDEAARVVDLTSLNQPSNKVN